MKKETETKQIIGKSKAVDGMIGEEEVGVEG
jgi:hypothetical protein